LSLKQKTKLTREKLLNALSYKKGARKIMMKLTPGHGTAFEAVRGNFGFLKQKPRQPTASRDKRKQKSKTSSASS